MSAEKAGPRFWPVEPREAYETLTCPRDRAGEGKWSPDPAFPPTGLQEVARRFRCHGCYSTVCDLPLDCPGEGRGLEGQEPEELVEELSRGRGVA